MKKFIVLGSNPEGKTWVRYFDTEEEAEEYCEEIWDFGDHLTIAKVIQNYS